MLYLIQGGTVNYQRRQSNINLKGETMLAKMTMQKNSAITNNYRHDNRNMKVI